MAKNRYAKDYQLTEHFDKKGHVRTTCSYIGTIWQFQAAPGKLKREKKAAMVCSILGWGLFLLALLRDASAMRRLYIALPYAFTAVPLARYLEFAIALRGMKEPLENRHADRLNNRYPPMALLLAILPGAALFGEGVNLLKGVQMLAGDGVFAVCAASIAAIGVRAFRARGVLRAVESD